MVEEIEKIIADNRGVEDSVTIAKIIANAFDKAEERHKEEVRKIIHEIEEGIANTTIVTEGTEYDFRQGYDTLEVDEVISNVSKKYGV